MIRFTFERLREERKRAPTRNFFQGRLEYRPALLLAKADASDISPEAWLRARVKEAQRTGLADWYSRNARKAGVAHSQVLLAARVWTTAELEGSSDPRAIIETERDHAESGLLGSSALHDRYATTFIPFYEEALMEALEDTGLFKDSASLISIYSIYVREYRSLRTLPARISGRPRRQMEST